MKDLRTLREDLRDIRFGVVGLSSERKRERLGLRLVLGDAFREMRGVECGRVWGFLCLA